MDLKNKNSLLIFFIGIGLLISLIGLIIRLIFPEIELGNNAYSLWFCQILGIILLITNGTILNTIYFRVIQFLIGFIFIGAMIKIMHWPGANIILLTSMIGIGVTYLIRFLKKKQKKRLDILKVLWVVTAYFSGALIVEQLINRDFRIIPNGLFWILIIDFIIQDYKKNKQNDVKSTGANTQ